VSIHDIAWWVLIAALVVTAARYLYRNCMAAEHKRERAVKLLASAYADEERARIYDERLAQLRREHGLDRLVCKPGILEDSVN
jgi:hypothetical protein